MLAEQLLITVTNYIHAKKTMNSHFLIIGWCGSSSLFCDKKEGSWLGSSLKCFGNKRKERYQMFVLDCGFLQ